MNIVLSFSALCILLVVGKLLRVEIRLFQKLYLPASVIGGLLGLVLVQTIGGALPAATMAGWNQLPGFLINIVFSALFLGVFIPPIRRIWGIAGPQLAYGQIVALLHESSLARTMPTDRILTCRCGMTRVGRGRSSDSRSHSRGRPHSPARLGSGREGHLR